MKRLKKILKLTGIVLVGLVAIGLVANACFVWITDTRLERQLAAIRAAGDPISLAELAPKPLRPEKDAATYLRRAEAGASAIHKQVEALPQYWEWFNGKGPTPAPIQKALKDVFSANPALIPLFQQAAACPDYDAHVDFTVSPGKFLVTASPDTQLFRWGIHVLQYRVRLLLAEGNHDEAARTGLLIARLGRLYERTPFLLGYLIAITAEDAALDALNSILQTGPVSKAVRDALDAELALRDRTEGYVRVLKGERAFTIGILSHSSYREFVSGSPFGNFWLIGRVVWDRRESEYLDKMQSFLALLREPLLYCQAEKMIGETDFHASVSGDRSGDLGRHPFHAIPLTFLCEIRTRAEFRCLRVLNALQTRVPAGSSATPKLNELGLPAEATIDPFNGEPLHVKRLPQGWLVYSVGPNFRDDGGNLGYGNDCDVGVGPPPTQPAKK